MTETTQSQRPTTPPGGAAARSPEFRLALDALRGLRQDLFHDAFAYRPLPRMSVDGPITRRLKGRLRQYAAWTPHAVVVSAGLLAMLVGTESSRGEALNLFVGVLALAPVLLTLVRPVGAFWVSLVAAPLSGMFYSGWYEPWPWPPGSFVTHLTVLTVVAVRTRPRSAAWMWVLTLAYGLLADTFLGAGYYDTNTGPMLILSAIILLFVAVLHIRREARQEVTAQQTVTEHERSRRTLLEERTTIARELHDVVAHHLALANAQAGTAAHLALDNPRQTKQILTDLTGTTSSALRELKATLGLLRQTDDDRATLEPSPGLTRLPDLITACASAGLTVTVTTEGEPQPLSPGVDLTAFRIVQEALTNVSKHAAAESAHVRLAYTGSRLLITVTDDGPASTVVAEGAQRGGFGVIGMRERALSIGGELCAGPRPEGGFEVTTALPLHPVAPQEVRTP